MPTVMLIDGNSLTYRAFFALPTDMATASGQVTNAVFGFTSMLINLMKDHEPDRIAVAFELRTPSDHEREPDSTSLDPLFRSLRVLIAEATGLLHEAHDRRVRWVRAAHRLLGLPDGLAPADVLLLDLLGLLGRLQVAVYNTDAPGLGHCDGKPAFRHRIHRAGHQRDVQTDVARQARV